ncbi:MAG: type II CRISPR-associated endonuclease Cas1 [Acidimicrobiia bacterium]
MANLAERATRAMGRAVILSDRISRIDVRDHQLRAYPSDGTEAKSAPCEDIDLLVLDTHLLIGLDSHVLQELAAARSAMLVTNRSHMPCGIFLPFSANLDHGAVTTAQFQMSVPRKKRAWQQIVRRKIRNQSALLEPGSAAYRRLRLLSAEVRSGDSSNAEAQAARTYWKAMLPSGVRRSARSRLGVNAALDYGYAVLRAALARSCVSVGLHVGLPLFHSNLRNPFALVDDLVEPWRPFVDSRARSLGIGEDDLLAPHDKAELVGVLHERVQCGGVEGPLTEAMLRASAAMKRYAFGEADELDLPESPRPRARE